MAGASSSPRSTSPPTVGEAELLRSVSSAHNSPPPAADDDGNNNQDRGAKKAKGKRTTSAAAADSKDTGKNKPTVAAVGSSEGGAADANAAGDGAGAGKTAKSAPQQQYVDHSYTNYAIVEEDDLRLLDENSSLLPNPASSGEASAREKLKGMSCTYGPMKKNAGGVVQPFPGKLLEVLDRSDLDEIIDWMPHGRAFIVKKPKLFTTNVLPRFFKQTKFLSFTRQLNLWGFKRITRGVDTGAYYHELFLRGRSYLAMRMRRQKIKGTGMKLTPNPDGEPDFYNDWPLVPPLNERRVLPPLPPLPSERLGALAQQPPGGGGPNGGANENAMNTLRQQRNLAGDLGMHPDLDGRGCGGAPDGADVSENILNALKYGGMRRLGVAGGGGGGGGGHSNHPPPGGHHQPPSVQGAQQQQQQQQQQRGGGYADASNPGRYDDLLLAPGVRAFEDASRLRYLEQRHLSREDAAGVAAAVVGSAPPGAAGPEGQLNLNDPIHDELSAMIRGRTQRAAAAAGAMGTGMFPPQQLSSDRLLMERLRDLDRAQQIKREHQDMSVLRRLADYEQAPQQQAGGIRAQQPPVSAPNAGQHGVPGGGHMGGPFDRFSYPTARLPQVNAQRAHAPSPGYSAAGNPQRHPGKGPAGGGRAGDPFARYGGSVGDPVESSVKDALREATHLEELALAQRAKAQSLALAGALHRAGGDPQQQQRQLYGSGNAGASRGTPGNEGAFVGDSRPSFGRPFGRKD